MDAERWNEGERPVCPGSPRVTVPGHQPKEKLELAGRKTVDILDRMEEIFLPKDMLLSSAGQVPLFYWLVRTHPQANDQFTREFLVTFERQRKANRSLVESNPLDKKIDRRLIEYDQYNRNTNDLASHRGRIEILEERLKVFRLEPRLFRQKD